MVHTVLFYVVTPYVTGGNRNISEGHAASIFSIDDLRLRTRPSCTDRIKSKVIGRTKKLDITALN
jgi:hypothetical protein